MKQIRICIQIWLPTPRYLIMYMQIFQNLKEKKKTTTFKTHSVPRISDKRHPACMHKHIPGEGSSYTHNDQSNQPPPRILRFVFALGFHFPPSPITTAILETTHTHARTRTHTHSHTLSLSVKFLKFASLPFHSVYNLPVKSTIPQTRQPTERTVPVTHPLSPIHLLWKGPWVFEEGSSQYFLTIFRPVMSNLGHSYIFFSAS